MLFQEHSARRGPFALLFILALCASFIQPNISNADSNSDVQLQLSVRRLNAWLTTQNEPSRWRDLLLLNILETQSAKGPHADPYWLGQVLQKFNNNHSSLSHPVFRDVQTAIAGHINQLNAANTIPDIQQAIQSGPAYRQPTPEEVAAFRDRLVTDIRIFENYLPRLEEEIRAPIVATMNTEEMVNFLNSLTFQSPPERSAGKLASAIADVRKQVEALDVEIEELEFQNDPAKADELAAKKARKAEVAARLAKLTSERTKIAQADRPRLLELRRVKTELDKFKNQLDEVAHTRADPFFLSIQNSFDRFYFRYFYAADDNLESKFDAKMTSLAEQYTLLVTANDRQAAAQIGPLLGWLEDAGQVPDLITAVRRKHSLPNLHVSISEQLLNKLGQRPINDSRPVAECLLGRFIQGTAMTNGSVNIETVNDFNQAHISIKLAGQINSKTYTKTGPITAYASGNGVFEARRSVLANIGGFTSGAPYAAARLQSNLDCVDAKLKIIRRIANKQYLKDKNLSEGISAGRIEKRLTDQFVQETHTVLKDGQAKVKEMGSNAVESSRFIPEVYLSTTSSHLLAAGMKSTHAMLAATNPAPRVSYSPDVQINVNETIASNYLDGYFNGKKFTREELFDQAMELTGEAPEALQADDEDEWAIWFARERPIQFEFENGQLGITVTARRFSKGDQSETVDLRIKLTFRMERKDEHLELVRQGKTVVELVNPEQSNARRSSFRTFLERQLNKETGEESAIILPDELLLLKEVPELAENEALNQMKLVQCRIEDGWMTLGWNHYDQPAHSSIQDTPAIWNSEKTQKESTDVNPPAPSEDK